VLDSREKPILIETYLRQRHTLKRFLKARLGSEEEAEDLVQELYIRLQRGPPAADIRSPAQYLFRMALNLALDHRRERQRAQRRDGQWVEARRTMVGAEPVTDLPSAETAYAAKQRVAAIVAALDELSVPCRRVFVMHKFDGLPHADVAARLGITRSTVEKHMNTAVKHLMRRLGGE